MDSLATEFFSYIKDNAEYRIYIYVDVVFANIIKVATIVYFV